MTVNSLTWKNAPIHLDNIICHFLVKFIKLEDRTLDIKKRQVFGRGILGSSQTIILKQSYSNKNNTAKHLLNKTRLKLGILEATFAYLLK